MIHSEWEFQDGCLHVSQQGVNSYSTVIVRKNGNNVLVAFIAGQLVYGYRIDDVCSNLFEV
jgi:hypothetical protein